MKDRGYDDETRVDDPVVDELRAAVLSWWEEHQFDARGERNLYNEPPHFVTLALKMSEPDPESY